MKALLYCVCFLLISVQLNGETMKTDGVLLHVKSIVNKSNIIEIAYRVENKTGSLIWLCEKMDWKKDTYESIVYKKDKKAVIKIRSLIVPKEIFLEEPIYAKYRRVLTGESLEYILQVEKPLYNRSPLKSDKNNTVNLNAIDVIVLEVGYLTQDLSNNSECCLKTSSPDELLVSCFWAESNSEKAVSVEMKNNWGK